MTDEIRALEIELMEKSRRLAELKRAQPPEPVDDYVLHSVDGPVRLSELFGAYEDLIVIHNMGKGCAYCTLWADGFNGLREHLENRAAFVVVSPDDPDTQRAFAESRGWGFRMVSGKDSTFTEAMGYRSPIGWQPGLSTFRRGEDGAIVRIATAPLGPGDLFCSLWHMIALLDGGAAGWAPKFSY